MNRAVGPKKTPDVKPTTKASTTYLQPKKPGRTFIPPKHILGVFNENFVFNREEEAQGKIRISKLTDDRMFFMSWYGNDLSELIIYDSNKFSNWWYAYVFGDKGTPSIANKDLKQKHLEQASYVRWVEYGTLYGMSRDSFTAISHSSENLIQNGVPDLAIHFETMYYYLVVLCLAQRASILRFSHEVRNISDTLDKKKSAGKGIKDLYKNYIYFINKLYFREISSQIQGIELYSQLQLMMNLEKEKRDLDEEVSELYNYSNMVEQSSLSRVANWFLPAGVIVGFLGMNVFGDDERMSLKFFPRNMDIDIPIWILFVMGTSWLIVTLIKFWNNGK